MTNDWEIKKLSEVCIIKPPKAEARQRLTDNDLVSFLPMEDMGIDEMSVTPTKERKLKDVAGSYTYFADNDVLLAKITPCFENGKLGIARNLKNGIGFGSSEYFVFRLNGHLIPEYLYYFLSQEAFREEGRRRMSGAVGHKRVSKDFIENSEIGVPSLAEQKRMVAILDEAFEAIGKAKQNAEKNLQNARELFESHLQAVFTQRDGELTSSRGDGWVEKPLGDIATFRNGINFTKTSRGETMRIVGVKDFQQNLWAPLDGLDTITAEGTLPDSDLLKENDILFVRSNGNMELIGRSLLVGPITKKITHSGFTIRARLNGKGTVPKYLCRFLKSNIVRRKMIDGGIGTNIKSLNQTTLSSLVIPLPPVSEQQQIVDGLDGLSGQTGRLESVYRRKIAALDELKKSLLHRAFSGEL